MVVLVGPRFITCDDTAQNVILPLQRSREIVTLFCFCSSVISFGTIFAHTFLMSRSSNDFPNCFSVDVHLLYYAPDSQLTTFTHNLMNFYNVFFSSACCWPS